jgi:hypothetical protein
MAEAVSSMALGRGADYTVVMAEPNTPPPVELPAQARRARLLLWLVVCFFITLNVMFFAYSCFRVPINALQSGGYATAKVIDHLGGQLESVAAAFRRGTITTAFVHYATTLTNTLHLEVATLRQMEVFTRQEEASTGFGFIPLPDVIVEARAPVEYTYFLDLKGRWRVDVKDGVVRVEVPALQFNTPALDVSSMTLEVRKGVFKVAEVQEKLRQSLSSLARRQAQENVPLVRENARRQVEAFVEGWLLQSFSDGPRYQVRAAFADEVPSVVPESAR